jgi:acetyl esterase
MTESIMANALTIDPQLFRSDAIDPETAAFNDQVEAQLTSLPGWYEPESAPALRELGERVFGAPPVSPLAQERSLPGPHGDIPVRVFLPETVRGVYLDIHGGGWTIGKAAGGDVLNERMARICEVAVVSVDYRLAPEFPYPIPIDDCEAAALWLTQHAREEFGSERLLIGGGSAGGQLAAATLLRLRDRHGYTGFAGANLIYGCYDLTMTPSHARFDRKLVLSLSLDRWFFDQFVPDAAKRRDSDISPLYADLHDMPPGLFTVGTLDPLLDDTLFMAARWLAAGNQTELAVYAGGVHGFNAFPIRLAEQANERMFTFLQAATAKAVTA